MRVIGMAFLCERCGAPICRFLPPVSLPPRVAMHLGFPFLPLLLRSPPLTRALRASPAHAFDTPALLLCALSLCHVFSPLPTTSPRPYPSSHGGAPLAPFHPNITVRYHCLCCTSSRSFHSWISPMPYPDVLNPFPWSHVVTEGLAPCPTNLREFRVAQLCRVAHRAS